MLRHFSASTAVPSVSGSPKNIKIASPINLSIVPPNFSAISVISDKYSLIISASKSGSNLSDKLVNSLISEKKIVNFLRVYVSTLSVSVSNIFLYIWGLRYFASWLDIFSKRSVLKDNSSKAFSFSISSSSFFACKVTSLVRSINCP